MATQKAIEANVVKNNHGVSILVGSSTTLATRNLGEPRTAAGSVVADTATTQKANSSGTVAFVGGVSMRTTVSLATVSNTALLTASIQPQLAESIHQIQTKVTKRIAKAYRDGYWNFTTGLFTTGPTVATDDFLSDVAANPTRAVPGKLAFKSMGPTITRVSYAAKTG